MYKSKIKDQEQWKKSGPWSSGRTPALEHLSTSDITSSDFSEAVRL